MDGHVWLASVLSVFVDFFLLLGCHRMAGYLPCYTRAFLAALLGGVHSMLACTPSLYFLGNWAWRGVFFLLSCICAFGLNTGALRRGVLFVLLRLALDGIALGVGSANPWSLAAGALLLSALCLVGFGCSVGRRYIPVELSYGGNTVSVTALHDTGNTLRDPLTGQSVVVVGPKVAGVLTGLTQEQLRTPASTLMSRPGFRLIPYHAVGKPNGLLLALRMGQVRIGRWKGSCLVAFAPDGFEDGEFQALTGGMV